LSIGEFNLTWMLHTPDTKTLPVGLADAYASMRLEVGSAYTILFLLMTLPLLIAMQWLGVDPAGAQSSRAAAKRKRALLRSGTPGQSFTQPSQPVETAR
jgi:putative spermidine/putrescine transport system permease protein